ncbi:hypothetical protein M431DRAFT_328621 [Trichoderma harzianum CBS 226.95]|uniref:Uncharacterized protein n=1 Tax=Trichoderma harzianum CBS 226.95 TaxID=983964 RepID=A0A2T3ZU40_TRIHA|nr:hypothetical protein M431DRAFT_328621 [Trichoderma harzianum CBS 226.95]PTB48324.1 hypothetical protein M431DRAFT_328621 [Trichoderma harzianum CBS 226.95]
MSLQEHTSYISGEDRITKVLVQRYYSIRPSLLSHQVITLLSHHLGFLLTNPLVTESPGHWSIYPKFNDEGVDIQHQNGFVATYRQNGTE